MTMSDASINPQPDWTVAEFREAVEEYRESEDVEFENAFTASGWLWSVSKEESETTLETVIRRLCTETAVTSVDGETHCPSCGMLSERLFGIGYCYQCDDAFAVTEEGDD